MKSKPIDAAAKSLADMAEAREMIGLLFEPFLRDLFACVAMAKLVGSGDTRDDGFNARAAYRQADAMLEQRKAKS
jgi:hypothetical protein